MEAYEKTQSRRDLITKLLAVNGYKATLDSLTGHTFKEGKIINMIKDPIAADLLPYLAIIHEEINFQNRMKFISVDGRPPEKRRPKPTNGNGNGDQPPELPPELLQILEQIVRQPAPRTKARPQPHAPSRTQRELFDKD